MWSTTFSKSIFLNLLVLCILKHACASPVSTANPLGVTLKENNEEVNDMKIVNLSIKNLKAQLPDQHHEDIDTSLKSSELSTNLKYDVEILESQDMKKEAVELEERFHGPGALNMDTNTFVAQNIEVNGEESKFVEDDDDDDDDNVKVSAILGKDSHRITLTIMLVLLGLVSIGLYVTLIMWRSHLEQVYGMRELLVTDEEDFYDRNHNDTA